MKFPQAALIAALVLSLPSFAGDKKKLTDAECQVKRTKLAELQEADLSTLKIDEATRQKMVDKEQMEISVKCPSGPH
jgi:hypothetical protein